MKKIALLLISMLFFATSALAAENWDSNAALKRVNTVGTKLIQANGVKQTIEFKVSDKEDVNAYANINKEVYVFKGLLQYVSNDTELAAVISHEVGHILNGHSAKQGVIDAGVVNAVNYTQSRRYIPFLEVGGSLATSKLSRHDEFEADITGIDLMAKAGYNTLGMVSLLGKINQDYIDFFESHPSGPKRILNAYNYIEYNYSNDLKKGFNTTSYKEAVKIITPKVEKRKQSEKNMKKFQKEQQRLLKRKEKRLKKIAKGSTIWEGYYKTVSLFME